MPIPIGEQRGAAMAIFRGGKFSGKYGARLAATDADVTGCQQLRYLAFIEARGLFGFFKC